ncbi:hypothetical protein DFJ73DRAFT_628822 [Zopfochytrium polystomum]|nr:hypothetical protein DFJ73DRAFT_628822 [Zopfochytrium polystomum]
MSFPNAGAAITTTTTTTINILLTGATGKLYRTEELLLAREKTPLATPYLSHRTPRSVLTQGFIGGEILMHLLAAKPTSGWHLTCLIRDDAPQLPRTALLTALGVDAVQTISSLDDIETIKQAASRADIAIHAADGSDHLASAVALLDGLALRSASSSSAATATVPALIHVSGVGVIMDDAGGESPPETVFDDAQPEQINDLPDSMPHRDVDLVVSGRFPQDRVKTVIVIPPLVYGCSSGPFKKMSSQIPGLVRSALRNRRAEYLGLGVSQWSNVHVEDLADFFVLLTRKIIADPESVPSGRDGYYFAESGHPHSWAELSHAIARTAHARGLVDQPVAVAIPAAAAGEALGNSRPLGLRYVSSNAVCTASRARAWGWIPKKSERTDVLASIQKDVEIIAAEEGLVSAAVAVAVST